MDTIDWQHNFYLSDIYTLTAGTEYRKEKGENKGNFDRSLDNKALYFNNKLMLLKEDLVLNAGVRYDDHETFGSKATYRIGALYNFRQMALRVKSSYGTGFRAPKFNELFFPFYGNPNLKPEESNSWEIGMEKDFLEKRITLSLTYFDQKYKNLIQTDPLTFTAANIARAEVKGIEVGAALKMTDTINIRAGYTYLNTRDKDTGQRLPLRPEDKVNISTEFYTKDMSVVANYTFVSKRFDSSVARDLSSYSLVNLAMNYRATKWLTFFARIDNLFDAHYEEVGSFGTPGFSVFGGIKITSL
jgi:vitamin B12 transporter